jgi:pilus assembly protein Flp/PilA
MERFAVKVRRFLKSEDGPTAVEYAFMLSLIIFVCIGAIASIGTKTNSILQNAASSCK